MANKIAEPKDCLKLACDFGGVSIGDGTARLGLTINREALTLAAAVKTFCGRRITGVVCVGDVDPDQTSFLNDAEYKIPSVFDCKRMGLTLKEYSLGLTFSLADIDAECLTHFAKKKGMLRVDLSSALPEKAERNGDDDEEEEDEGDE
jgi:hypothetical protein